MNPPYSVYIYRTAQKSLRRIPREDQILVISAIRKLADDPRPHGSKKLSGRDARRIRVGRYRVIYEIEDDRLMVTVVAAGHRRDVYRDPEG